MEYKKILEELEKISNVDTSLVFLKNSIEKYNFFINLYNSEINIVNNNHLSLVPCQKIYSMGYKIQSNVLKFSLLFIIVPAIIITIKYLLMHCFEKTINHENEIFFIILTTYNSLIFFICLVTFMIQYLSKLTYKKNEKIVSNPFQNMVYYPDLCYKKNINNQFMNINIEDLDKINISESQKNKIKENNNKYLNEAGKIKFMIYDQGLIDYYSGIKKSRITVKHMIWLIVSIFMLLFFIFFHF